MVNLLTAAVFLLVVLGTICAGVRAGPRTRAIDRLAPRPARPPRAVPISPALFWRELVKRLGPGDVGDAGQEHLDRGGVQDDLAAVVPPPAGQLGFAVHGGHHLDPFAAGV